MKPSPGHSVFDASRRRGFTLIELMVAMAVLALLMVVMVSMVDAVTKQVQRSTKNTEAFRAARTAFESITRQISQATLNPYWAYDDPVSPTEYIRRSELRFISGEAADLIAAQEPNSVSHCLFFQAPLGQVDDPDLSSLDTALNTWGYYIDRNTDTDFPPGLGLTGRDRYRLMELREPSENLEVYNVTSGDPESTSRTWFTTPMADDTYKRAVADNIIAMVILPKLSSNELPTVEGDELVGSDYTYDSSQLGEGGSNPLFSSQNQLPPIVEVTLIAIDENSAQRVEDGVDISALDGLFQDPESFEDDLQTAENILNQNNLTYRIFSTEVQLPASKWSVD